MPEFRLALFGSPQLLRDGQLTQLGTRKNIALLAYLAMNEREQSRESLAALLWPEQSERHARASLRQALSSIRQALGGELLLTGREHIGLLGESGLSVDALDFRRLVDSCCRSSERLVDDLVSSATPLAQAVELYTGDFLAGFTLPDCSIYDEWRFFQAESLRNSLALALQTLTSWHRTEHEYELAITYGRRWVALDRLHEPAQRELMTLYALAGQHAAAVRQYEECVRVLDEELGVLPDNETQVLYEAVRNRSVGQLQEVYEKETPEAAVMNRALSSLSVRSVAHDEFPNNLPAQSTPFVGREEELSELLVKLRDPECRLLTLVGPGGIGKTRLAIKAARRLLVDSSGRDSFSDGIFFVSLQPISVAEDIVTAIADAINFRFQSYASPRTQLLGYLQEKYMLLVLDNFEHLLLHGNFASAELVAEILMGAPNVKILTTSREGLKLRQEWFHPLAGMRFSERPDVAEHEVSGYDAVRLFVQNAQRRQPDFSLTDVQEEVVEICRLLDGMPLGIELASAWLDVLSCAQIADEIERGLDILIARHHDIPERHRSMRVLVENAWRRLSEDEQVALMRLSVFRGGFTREGAERVADATLGVLSSLIVKSFVRFDRVSGRYDIHELLRQYGVDRLAAEGSNEAYTRSRHAAYFCALLNRGYEELKGGRQQETLAMLSREQGNLRAAWEYATAQCSLELIGQALDGLGRLFEWTGNLSGGVSAFAAVAEDARYAVSLPARRIQAHALAWLAYFETLSGNTERAKQDLERSVAILDDLAAAGRDTRHEKALALLHWGHLELPRNLESAVRVYSQSSKLFAEIGHKWEGATARMWLGEAQREIGRIAEATELLHQALAVFEDYGDQRSVATVLENIARSYLLDKADLETARDTAQASLELRRRSGDRAGIASTLLVLAYVYCWLNQPAAAEPLTAEALAIARDLGHRSMECEAYYITMVVYNYLEDLEKKRANGERGLELARKLGDVRLIGNFLRSLADIFLALGDAETAHKMHVEAFEVQQQAGIQVMLPWLHLVRAYSSWKVGQYEEVDVHIDHALRACTEHTDDYTAVHALLFLAQVVATQGNLERAVEIGAAARAVSRWERSLTGRKVFVEPLEELTRNLSPELAAAAKARGRNRDIWTIAVEFLDEIKGPIWQWA